MAVKLQFVGEFVSALADAMLRIAGERIATPACGLVRNDTVVGWWPVAQIRLQQERYRAE